MKNIKSNQKNIIWGIFLVLGGLLLGWIFFGGNSGQPVQNNTQEMVAEDYEPNNETLWTCSMHPQIREEEPGNCPICGMELIPLENGAGTAVTTKFETEMSPAAVQLANIQTTVVGRQVPEKTIYMPGKVKADERRIEAVTSRFPGRIEKLYIDFTGQEVSRGQRLASVYSPELVTAQKELFEASKFRESNPGFFTAAVNKLKLWDLTEGQIQQILESKEPVYNFDIRSKQSGTVLEKEVQVGDYLKEGQTLFEISNLNSLWVTFDAYESDLPWIKEGDSIKFTVQSLPGKTFKSKVTFIDPVINPNTRVASVRTEIKNPDDDLKPEMFAQGIIQAGISKAGNAITIPKSAILWTGKRAVVYVKKQDAENPVFEFRQIDLGADAGDYYVVESGLEVGEEIVTNGTFKIDAAAQLKGKASMMNPNGGSAGGSMPGMDMGGGPNNQMDEKEQIKEGQVSTEEFLKGKAYDFRKETPEAFRKQLDAVIDAYLSLKDGMVEANEKDTFKYSTQLFEALQDVDGSVLKGGAKAFWEEKRSFLMQHAKLCKEASTIAGKRENFIYLSQPLIKVVEAYGPGDEKLYVDFCPMANNNKGGFWMSRSKEIVNPFMGQAMRSCGEVKQEIASNK